MTQPDKLTIEAIEAYLVGDYVDANPALQLAVFKQLADTMRENETLKKNLVTIVEQFKKYAATQSRPYMGYDVDEVREALSNKDSVIATKPTDDK